LPNEAYSGAIEGLCPLKLPPHGFLALFSIPRVYTGPGIHCSCMHVIIHGKTKLGGGRRAHDDVISMCL